MTDSDKLDVILTEIIDMKTEMQGMKSDILGVKAEMQGMKSDMQGVKTEIRGMKSDIQGVKAEMQGMKSDIQGVKTEMQGMKSDIQNISLNTRMDSLEFQIKSTERVLRNQITKSETLILGEVERVHLILDQHIHNQTIHTALA